MFVKLKKERNLNGVGDVPASLPFVYPISARSFAKQEEVGAARVATQGELVLESVHLWRGRHRLLLLLLFLLYTTVCFIVEIWLYGRQQNGRLVGISLAHDA